MIIARSFARIHETNLKKQGIIPFTFVDPKDYEKISYGCLIRTIGLTDIAPGSSVSLKVTYHDGTFVEIPVKHTMSADQIEYFKHGSALNLIAAA